MDEGGNGGPPLLVGDGGAPGRHDRRSRRPQAARAQGSPPRVRGPPPEGSSSPPQFRARAPRRASEIRRRRRDLRRRLLRARAASSGGNPRRCELRPRAAGSRCENGRGRATGVREREGRAQTGGWRTVRHRPRCLGKARMQKEIATPRLCISCWKRVLGSFLFFYLSTVIYISYWSCS